MPDHVTKELLKLKWRNFDGKTIDYRRSREITKFPVEAPTKTRPSIVINHHPEYQTTF